MSRQDRSLLIVAGPGRSGTSLFSTSVHQLGFHIPQPEIAANDTNPRGFGEPKWAVEYHNRLMESVHVRFEDARPAAWRGADRACQQPKAQRELKEWLGGQFEISDRVAVKDPRLTWFTDLYDEVAKQIPARLGVVTMLRHPIETTKSRQLHYGEGLSATSRLAAWINQMLTLEQRTRRLPRALVRYDGLLSDWRAELERADAPLGVGLLSRATPEQTAAVDDLIEPSLRRAQSSWEELDVPDHLAALADDAWDALCEAADAQGGDTTAVESRIDDLVERYHRTFHDAREIARSAVLAARDDERAKLAKKEPVLPPESVVPPERPPARALAATAKYRTIDAVNRLRRAPVRRRVYILVLSADERTGVTTTMTSLANELCQRHDVEIISLFKMDDDARLPLDPRIHLSYLENLRQPAGAPGPRILRAKNNPHRHPDDRRLDGLKSQLFDDSAPTSRLTDLLLERRLKTLRPGVLLSNRPMLHLAAARWAPKHTSVIAVEHATFLQRQEGILKLYSRIADRLAAIVTLTPQDQAAFQELVSGRTQVALIPNGVPSPGQQVSSLDSKVIVSAGELIGRKGFDRLIDSFAPLATGHPDWRVEIYGQGSKQQELKDQIRRLDLEGQVLLKGFDKNFQETLRNASIYAMGSRFEAFPMVLLEAMSVGVPVISFDCPSGPGNLITDGEDGLLIPDDDIAAYTAGLEKLMDDEYRRRLAKGALQTIAKYDVSAIANRWEQLFDEVV